MPVNSSIGGFPSSPGSTKGVFTATPDQQDRTRAATATGSTTGDAKLIGRFESTAYGPPWNAMNGTGVTADGTDLRPDKKVYGVAVDPKKIPLGTLLHIQPNPFNWEGTFKAFDTGGAIKGNRIDFYDWRGRAAQMKWGRKTVQVYKAPRADSKMSAPGTGGLDLPSLGSLNPLNAVDEAASAVREFISFLLSPKSIGGLLAKIAAMFVKLIFRAMWDYVIAPILHWHQRATLSYWKARLGGSDEATGISAFVTLSFWATGYAILWAKVDGERKFVTDPGSSALGSFLRSVGNTRARRSLVKPKDVQRKTPKKPEPVRSTATISREGTMAASRRRTVRVEGMSSNDVYRRDDAAGAGAGTDQTTATGEDEA